MATIDVTSIPVPAGAGRNGGSGLVEEFRRFWIRLVRIAFNPYRPELHYMRGPGPAWRAKHGMDAPFRLKPRDV